MFDKVSALSDKNRKFFENLWTVTDLARFLRVQESTVYQWVHEKKVPFHKVNRLVRFKPSEIEKWLLGKE